MSRPTIIINELDAERIDRLLEKAEFAPLPVADALNEELDRAQMCTPETMPHDVVTMNSQVKFRNLTTGEELTRTLVYPAQMTDSSAQLSVLAPVGSAIVTNPFPTASSSRPIRAAFIIGRSGGSLCPRSSRKASSSTPAERKRMPAIISGGQLSTPMRMTK